MATSGGEQVRSRAHPMVPSARPEEEYGGLATCACGSAVRRLTAATLWGATGCEDKPRETGWPQRARGWAPLVPRQGAAARPRARAAAARALAWLASMADTVVRGSEAREEAMAALGLGWLVVARPHTHAERWRRSSGCPLEAAQRPDRGACENGRGRGERGVSAGIRCPLDAEVLQGGRRTRRQWQGELSNGHGHGRPRGGKPQNNSATFKSSRPAQKPLKNRLNHYNYASLTPKPFRFDTSGNNKFCRAI